MRKLLLLLLLILSQNISFGQWVEQPTTGIPFNLFSCSFPSLNTGFAVGYGGRMIKTTNGGTNWYSISIFPTTAQDLNSVWFTDENTGWMVSTTDTLYKTTNSGVTWTAHKSLQSYGYKIIFANSATGWIAAQPFLYKTTDHGDNWNIINSQMWYYFTFLNENAGWKTSYNAGSSTIHKTTDGGFTWTPQHTTTDFRVIYAIKFIDENTGWAAGYREHILKTTNGGLNWELQRDMGNSTSLTSIDFINPNTGWIVGGSGYSLYTIDGGSTWNQIFLASGGGNIQFVNSNTGWIVGSKIFKTTTAGLIPRTLQLSILPEGFYNDVSNAMVPDTVTAYLRRGAAPYQIVDSAKAYINSSGNGTYNFLSAVNGEQYYIITKHRNTIETWSSAVHSFVSNSLAYDFTSSSSMAFGNNMKLKGSRWTIFSGDVNNDGFVNLTDLIQISNDAANFKSGYLITDLNGDNSINLSDVVIAFNNSQTFVSVVKP
ncbi:MAG: YCF48-related protein [Ignavibacteria bacterium]